MGSPKGRKGQDVPLEERGGLQVLVNPEPFGCPWEQVLQRKVSKDKRFILEPYKGPGTSASFTRAQEKKVSPDSSPLELSKQTARLVLVCSFHQRGWAHWSSKWQPAPAFLPGESHGQRSLAAYSPWGHLEAYSPWGHDTTEHACTLNLGSLSLPISLLSGHHDLCTAFWRQVEARTNAPKTSLRSAWMTEKEECREGKGRWTVMMNSEFVCKFHHQLAIYESGAPSTLQIEAG